MIHRLHKICAPPRYTQHHDIVFKRQVQEWFVLLATQVIQNQQMPTPNAICAFDEVAQPEHDDDDDDDDDDDNDDDDDE